MTLPTSSNQSLYQIAEKINPQLPTVLVSPKTVEEIVSSLLTLLLEEKIQTRIWVKPATSWSDQLEKFQQQGNFDQIYWFQTQIPFREKPLNPIQREQIVSIELITNPSVEKEFFLALASSELAVLLITQQQPVSTIPTKLSRRQPSLKLKLIYSFEPIVLEEFLKEVKTLTDPSTPSTILSPPSYLRNSAIASSLMTKLLLKQIENTEAREEREELPKTKDNQGWWRESLLFREDFLNQLNRELRPPLTNMKTALCLLESKYLKKQQRQKYIDLLNREWQRQNCLLTGLLELVQMERMTIEPTDNFANLTELLPGIISTYQPLAKEKEISLGYTLAKQLPLVACPSLWLKQIILNLLSNHLKYTAPGGKIFIEATSHNNQVELSFSDTGIGIEPQEMPKIFNSFYRGRNSLGEEDSGAGLGLTIVKQLLERCGGSISVLSQPEKGSTFKVFLPITHG